MMLKSRRLSLAWLKSPLTAHSAHVETLTLTCSQDHTGFGDSGSLLEPSSEL